MLNIKRITDPTKRALDTEEVRLFLKLDSSADDSIVESLIRVAQNKFEIYCNRSLVDQTWRMYLDHFPYHDHIHLYKPPVISITHLKYYDTLDVVATFASSNYLFAEDTEGGRLVLNYNGIWPSTTLRPANAVEIEYQTGYGTKASNIPIAIREGLLHYCFSLYENRGKDIELPGLVKELWDPYRTHLI